MSKVKFEDLLKAGVHFGHLKRKWNPSMAPYIFEEKNHADARKIFLWNFSNPDESDVFRGVCGENFMHMRAKWIWLRFYLYRDRGGPRGVALVLAQRVQGEEQSRGPCIPVHLALQVVSTTRCFVGLGTRWDFRTLGDLGTATAPA